MDEINRRIREDGYEIDPPSRQHGANGLLLTAGDRMAAPVGQTSARWQVMGVIDHEPITVSAVARQMGLRRQSVQRTADLLVADGVAEYLDNPAEGGPSCSH